MSSAGAGAGSPDGRLLSAWAYVGYGLLFLIPVVGLVCLIAFSCESGNLCRRSFARSYWCWTLIVLLLSVGAFILLRATGSPLPGVIRAELERVPLLKDILPPGIVTNALRIAIDECEALMTKSLATVKMAGDGGISITSAAYVSALSQYADAMRTLEALGNGPMTDADAAYYDRRMRSIRQMIAEAL